MKNLGIHKFEQLQLCLEAWIGSQTGGMAILAKPRGCRKSNHLHWMKVVVGWLSPNDGSVEHGHLQE